MIAKVLLEEMRMGMWEGSSALAEEATLPHRIWSVRLGVPPFSSSTSCQIFATSMSKFEVEDVKHTPASTCLDRYLDGLSMPSDLCRAFRNAPSRTGVFDLGQLQEHSRIEYSHIFMDHSLIELHGQ